MIEEFVSRAAAAMCASISPNLLFVFLCSLYIFAVSIPSLFVKLIVVVSVVIAVVGISIGWFSRRCFAISSAIMIPVE